MAPPDRVFRSPSQSLPPQPIGLLGLFGGPEAAAARQTPTNRGILGFMVPPDAGEGYRHTSFVPNAQTSRPSDAAQSIDEMTRAELQNLTPYERWLVTLPDDSPELTSFSDPRVGPAPIDPPRHLISEATIDPGSVILTASDAPSGQVPIPPEKPGRWSDDGVSSNTPISTKNRETTWYSDKDIDALARTIYGEANAEHVAGQIAVGQTVLNRALKNLKKKYGTSVYDVVHKPGHYEPWTTRKGELESLHLNHPKRYEQLKELSRQILNGEFVDLTNGATHFAAQTQIPDWAFASEDPEGPVDPRGKIGGHIFWRYQRPPRPEPVPIPYRPVPKPSWWQRGS